MATFDRRKIRDDMLHDGDDEDIVKRHVQLLIEHATTCPSAQKRFIALMREMEIQGGDDD